MRADLADVTLVVDRSASMVTCREEAENGVNHFVDEQKKQAGECLFSLVQFDIEYDFVHRAVPIHNVARYTLLPRGMTALLDAVGRSINETGERLAAIPEEQRPGLVVFVIVTDGFENSSREFTKDQVKKMIELQQGQYGWQFTFLGANQDAFTEAARLGIPSAAAANFNQQNVGMAFQASSSSVSRMRSSSSRGSLVRNAYSEEERKLMTGK